MSQTCKIDRAIALAQALSNYLAHVPAERFKNAFEEPRLLEERFYRVTRFLEEQLIPKEQS